MDWALILLSIVSYILTFTCSTNGVIELLCFLTGVIGLAYCLYYIFIWIFKPIKKDWILVRGAFLRKVACFVLFLPLAVTSLIQIFSGGQLSPKEIVYLETLSAYDNDTVRVEGMIAPDSPFMLYAKVNGLEVLNDSLDSSTSVIVPVQSLPDPISTEEDEHNLLWSVYYHFVDPGNQHMISSRSGRGWSALAAIFGVIFLNGLLMSTLINYFDKRKSAWENGNIRYDNSLALRSKKYAVIIGYNETVAAIVRKLLGGVGQSEKVDYVILLTDGGVIGKRNALESQLTSGEIQKLIIYNGQTDAIEEICRLGVDCASEIYVLGDDNADGSPNSYHDSRNMKSVYNIAEYLEENGVEKKKVCRVQFTFSTSYSVFQFSDLPENISRHLVFIPFNIYENWAHKVLVSGRYTESVGHDHIREISYTPIDGSGIGTDCRNYVHFIVIGMTEIGCAMAVQAAQIAHYPNFKAGQRQLRTRITFIDPDAENQMNCFKGRFLNLFELSRTRYMDCAEGTDTGWCDPMDDKDGRYSYLGENFIDLEWEFIKGSVSMPEVREYLENAAEEADSSRESHSLLTIAVCYTEANDAVSAGIYMPDKVYDSVQQIFIYQKEASDIVYNLYFDEGGKSKRYSKLRPFGMQCADFTNDREYFTRAQICNYIYTMMFDDTIDNSAIYPALEKIGCAYDRAAMKPARDAWKHLNIFNKWSNRYNANSFDTKLRSCGVSGMDYVRDFDIIRSAFLQNSGALAECEHNRWNVQQLLMGFRAYTEEENRLFFMLRDRQNDSEEAKADFRAFKEKMKGGAEKAHLDICSFEYLDNVDVKAKGYDEILNNAIPIVLKLTKLS